MKVSQKSEKVGSQRSHVASRGPTLSVCKSTKHRKEQNTADGREEEKNKYNTLAVRLRMCVLMNQVVKSHCCERQQMGMFYSYRNNEIKK